MNARKNVGPLCKKTGDLANWDVEKLELLNYFFCLGLFPQDLQPHELLKGKAGAGRMNNHPL